MTKERRRPHAAVFLLAVTAVLFIGFGIGGISIGGVSAEAGWWMVAAGLIGLVLVAIELVRR